MPRLEELYAIDGPENPDFPGQYVVRRWRPTPEGETGPEEQFAAGPTYEGALAQLPDKALLLGRAEGNTWNIMRIHKHRG